MKQVALLVVFAATFAVVANAQRYGSSTCGLTPGPCMERFARQGYAPVDYYLNNGYGYGYGGYGGYGYYGNGRLGVSALVGAATGALAGGLVASAVSHRSNNRVVYAAAPNGGQYYASAPQRREVRWVEPKRQKPLDCRKPSGKNKAACEAAAVEVAAQQQAAERQTCLDQLASSSWRLRNGSAVFPAYPTINDRPLMICGEPLIVKPRQTVRIFPPDGQVSGKMFGAGSTGEKVELTAKVWEVNEPGFIGFVLLAPCEPNKPCMGGN